MAFTKAIYLSETDIGDLGMDLAEIFRDEIEEGTRLPTKSDWRDFLKEQYEFILETEEVEYIVGWVEGKLKEINEDDFVELFEEYFPFEK